MISKPSKLENRSLLLYNYSALEWAERASHVWVVFRNQSSKYILAGPLPFPLCSLRTSTDQFNIVQIGRKELPLMYDGLVPSDHPSHP
jgi:hypothetical protein